MCRPDGVVLDYGCGEALSCRRVAAAAGRLVLCEAAPNVRATLAQRFAANRKIAVRSPGRARARCRDASFDLIVHAFGGAISDAAELDALLRCSTAC